MSRRTDSLRLRLTGFALIAAAFSILASPVPAGAQDGDRWMVRSHVSGVLLDAESDALGLEVENTITVGTDVTFFATPHVAVNALAAFISPEVEAGDGATNLGSVDALPPALTVQYHFLDEGPVRPYVGAGGSYVNFYGESGVLDDIQVEIDDGWGIVGQGGLNVFVTDDFAIMGDFRWVEILNDPAVTTDLGNDELDLRHFIVSVGVGFTL